MLETIATHSSTPDNIGTGAGALETLDSTFLFDKLQCYPKDPVDYQLNCVADFIARDHTIATELTDAAGCGAAVVHFDAATIGRATVACHRVAVVAQLLQVSDTIAALFAGLASDRTYPAAWLELAGTAATVISYAIAVVAALAALHDLIATLLAWRAWCGACEARLLFAGGSATVSGHTVAVVAFLCRIGPIVSALSKVYGARVVLAGCRVATLSVTRGRTAIRTRAPVVGVTVTGAAVVAVVAVVRAATTSAAASRQGQRKTCKSA